MSNETEMKYIPMAVMKQEGAICNDKYFYTVPTEDPVPMYERIEDLAISLGDTLEYINIQKYKPNNNEYDPTSTRNILPTEPIEWEKGKHLLPNHMCFYVYGAKNIYFMGEYDGRTWLIYIPRHPTLCKVNNAPWLDNSVEL